VSTLRGRTCLVTGATDGHGRAVARELARRGAELVLHGRDPEKTRRVQAEISAENGGRRPEILLCDLASREAIDRAAASSPSR
jgi:short-subunit dehydrogenase